MVGEVRLVGLAVACGLTAYFQFLVFLFKGFDSFLQNLFRVIEVAPLERSVLAEIIRNNVATSEFAQLRTLLRLLGLIQQGKIAFVFENLILLEAIDVTSELVDFTLVLFFDLLSAYRDVALVDVALTVAVIALPVAITLVDMAVTWMLVLRVG